MSGPTSVSPAELAAVVRPLLDRALVAFDVDGVLAPLVDHADDSVLLPGVHDALGALAQRTEVGIVSGRALESLERLFRFPEAVHVVGSHGLEQRGVGTAPLDVRERETFEQLRTLASRAADAAGDGAWLEYKPASIVVHTRTADEALSRPAVDALTRLAGMVDGAQVKPGSDVVELLARSASKGAALCDLAARLDRRPIVYFGDDVTDEDAFAVMGGDDVSVRVGPGPTAATHRLAGPAEASEVLCDLAER